MRPQDPGTLREIAMHCMALRGIAQFFVEIHAKVLPSYVLSGDY